MLWRRTSQTFPNLDNQANRRTKLSMICLGTAGLPHNRKSKLPGSTRRSTPLNFCPHLRQYRGKRGVNTTTQSRGSGPETRSRHSSACRSACCRWRGETADFQYAERYERRWSRTSAGAASGPTSWCSRDYLGRPASSCLQLSSLATVSGVDRVTERPAAPFTTRVRALARLRRASGAHQPQKAAPRLPSFPSRHW